MWNQQTEIQATTKDRTPHNAPSTAPCCDTTSPGPRGMDQLSRDFFINQSEPHPAPTWDGTTNERAASVSRDVTTRGGLTLTCKDEC